MNPSHRRVVVLDAPSNLGLKPSTAGQEPGVRYMPTALRRHGIVRRLHALDAGVVIPPEYNSAIDAQTGIRNAASICSYSIQLAQRIEQLLDGESFPLVLGGDCSILLASALALRKRGNVGLLFIDGHTDLLTPQTSGTAGAAGMDLALATGIGPELLTSIQSQSRYFKPSDVVLFGYRWPAPGSQNPATPPPQMIAYPLQTIRRCGLEQASADAVSHFGSQSFWLHVDFDVLDPTWMPAVDSPDPGGMRPEELLAALRVMLRSQHCIGMELTIYDPTKDPDGRYGSLIVDLLTDAFRGKS